jgi:hypothetical protein
MTPLVRKPRGSADQSGLASKLVYFADYAHRIRRAGGRRDASATILFMPLAYKAGGALRARG